MLSDEGAAASEASLLNSAIDPSAMDRQQQQSKHVMLPCVERQSDWKDDWTYSEHVIGANERLRIIHEGRALARQREVEAQAALRRRRQEQSDIEVPNAA
jgi:hypothetical protein